MSAPKEANFWNGWSLKDVLILGGILAGIAHNASTSSETAKAADESVTKAETHIAEKLAVLTEHQVGQDRLLVDHEGRIRTLEFRK